MNLLAMSPKHNILFIAAQNKIYAFPLHNDGQLQDYENPKIYQITNEDV